MKLHYWILFFYSCTTLLWAKDHTALLPRLTREQATTIGKKLWHNECGSSYDKLTWWAPHEAFPSIGIGHFIWYPQGIQQTFTQTFPDFAAFLVNHDHQLPKWLLKNKCPWQDRTAFYADMQQRPELQKILTETFDMQARFIIERSQKALKELISQTPAQQRNTLQQCIQELAQTKNGIFCLIDYYNFKGMGTNLKERYNNHGWGLLQVLTYIIKHKLPVTPTSFATAAATVLQQRAHLSPKGTPDKKCLPGWLNRIKRYI